MARYPRSQAVRVVDEPVLTRRRTRSPQHPFALQVRPWVLYPCLCAPVLPGETMKNAVLQMRVVSDPIVSNVQGWWLEFYLFYVRAGDLRDAFDDVVRNVAASVQTSTGITDAVSWPFYHGNSGVPSMIKRCTKAVVDAYFRYDPPNSGGGVESEPAAIVTDLPTLRVAGNSYWDSVYDQAVVPPNVGSDSWNQQWQVFQQLRSVYTAVDTGTGSPGDAGYVPGSGIADPTNQFKEYLAKMGVRVAPQLTEPEPAYQKPELVRFVRDFAYPVPTVNQTDGTIKSTVQWSMAERCDKRRFMAEPGWLCGYVSIRPKVYMARAKGAWTDIINNTSAGWLPPEFDTEPATAILNLGTASAIVNGSTVATVWADARDLYLYGDQFLNFNPGTTLPTGAMCNLVALPSTDLTNKRYPVLTDAQGLFVDSGAMGTAQFLHVDGMMSFRIATRIGSDVSN